MSEILFDFREVTYFLPYGRKPDLRVRFQPQRKCIRDKIERDSVLTVLRHKMIVILARNP